MQLSILSQNVSKNGPSSYILPECVDDITDNFGPIRYTCPKTCSKCKGEGCIIR